MEIKAARTTCAVLTAATLCSAQPRWSPVSSPVRDNLERIVFTTPAQGFIAGPHFLEIRDGSCRLVDRFPSNRPVVIVSSSRQGTCWAVTDMGVTSESRLYTATGGEWKERYHPFANQIQAIARFPDGRMFIGGFGEVAVSNRSGWTMLPAMPGLGGCLDAVCIDNRRVIILHRNLSLFVFSTTDTAWQPLLPGRRVTAIAHHQREGTAALAGDTLFLFSNGTRRIHSVTPLLSGIQRLAFSPQGSLWGAGTRGTIVRWAQTHWEQQPTPTTADLRDLVMINEEEGWSIGTDGTILHRTANEDAGVELFRGGFEQMKVSQYGRDLNDEYGIAFEDLTGDGKPDIYAVCIFNSNRLYVNRTPAADPPLRTPVFVEESFSRGLTGRTGESIRLGGSELFIGVGVADIDNDGDQDGYLCGLLNRNRLLLNDGTGVFRNVSMQARRATDSIDRSNAAVFADVDNDGDLDLFVANENNTNRLYLNNGNGYFEEATDNAGLRTEQGGTSAVFGDIDGDGDQDLFVANWSERNRLYRNDSSPGRVRFTDLTDKAGVGGAAWSKSNASVFADIDNDGDLDLFVANRRASNRLYRNDGAGHFTDCTAEVLGIDSLQTYGAVVADADNDGLLDLFITNVGESKLYRNDGKRRLVDVTMKFGAGIVGYGTGTACGDIDGDGDVDIYAGVFTNGNSLLLVNRISGHNFITVRAHGSISNRDAVGAKVRLFRMESDSTGSLLAGFREVSGGSGYGSSNSKTIHFGAPSGSMYTVEVEFPTSGIRRRVGPIAPGAHLDIEEEEGTAVRKTRLKNFVSRTFTDREVLVEAGKGLLAVFLAIVFFRLGKRRLGWKGPVIVSVHAAVVFVCLFQMRLFFEDGVLISTVLPISSVPILLAIVHLYYERVILGKRIQSEKEVTRNQIARDLHDDLASTLGGASIYAQSLQRSAHRLSEADQKSLTEVNVLLGEASEAVTDIVWTVSPRHDRLDDLILRLQTWLADGCRIRGIEFSAEVAEGTAGVPLSDDIRRNIYLIFKEATNNIFKHSLATSVGFTVAIRPLELTLALSDNGIGIPPLVLSLPHTTTDPVPVGNGLINMRRRAGEIGADLTIDSGEGRGTIIRLTLKMIQMHH